MRILTLIALAFSITAHAELRYRDVAPIVAAKCAVCHRGPFLDFSVFPFRWDQSGDPLKLGREMARRINSTDKYQMPPVNAKPLRADEHSQLVDWISGGMLP